MKRTHARSGRIPLVTSGLDVGFTHASYLNLRTSEAFIESSFTRTVFYSFFLKDDVHSASQHSFFLSFRDDVCYLIVHK